MGKRLNELKKGLALAARKCAISYEEYHEDTDELEDIRKEFYPLREKFSKSNDAKAKEKISKDLDKLRKRYSKVGGHRECVKKEFRRFLGSYKQWYDGFCKHIHDRQIHTKWRSAKHTKEAIQLGIEYGKLQTKYDDFHASFYK